MVKSVLVMLAEGFEEIEAITPIDLLRRSGANVTVASVGDELDVVGSHDLVVRADILIADCTDNYDCVLCPGGGLGSKNLAASFDVLQACIKTAQHGVVAAICAAPAVVLGKTGLLTNHRVTGYPGSEKECEGLVLENEKVITDGYLITAQAAGSAMEFALAIIARLFDERTAKKIAEQVVF